MAGWSYNENKRLLIKIKRWKKKLRKMLARHRAQRQAEKETGNREEEKKIRKKNIRKKIRKWIQSRQQVDEAIQIVLNLNWTTVADTLRSNQNTFLSFNLCQDPWSERYSLFCFFFWYFVGQRTKYVTTAPRLWQGCQRRCFVFVQRGVNEQLLPPPTSSRNKKKKSPLKNHL